MTLKTERSMANWNETKMVNEIYQVNWNKKTAENAAPHERISACALSLGHVWSASGNAIFYTSSAFLNII